MTRIEYELLREQEPHLRLPAWTLGPVFSESCPFVKRVKAVTRDQLIGLRVAYIMKGDFKYWILYDA